ncbi:RING finger protein [Mycena sanguinolenta]|uniref:RING finger protein n=1 Tax=Mycena sanguinolenta TaxID=230812 RepID=A0A8H6XVX8_9AGAR|nr:RING finger protein [Mycena sanguinolenta]
MRFLGNADGSLREATRCAGNGSRLNGIYSGSDGSNGFSASRRSSLSLGQRCQSDQSRKRNPCFLWRRALLYSSGYHFVVQRSGHVKAGPRTQPEIQVTRLFLFSPALCLKRSGVSAGNQDELASLLIGHAALENYSRRPDCFRRVAGKIQLRCGELEMNEDERVRAAISMTLSLRLKARENAWSSNYFSAEFFDFNTRIAAHSPGAPNFGRVTRAICAKFASSISLRFCSAADRSSLLAQLCFAFRRWNDIDTAKDIYKNSITEMSAIARAILAREQVDVEAKRRWDTEISGLQDVAIRLKTVSEVIDNMMTMRLRSELTDVIVDAFRSELENVQINTRIENARMINQIGSELQFASQSHAHSLNDLVPFLQKSLVNDLNAALSPFWTQSRNAFDLAASAHDRWVNLTVQFNAMQQTILELSGSVSETAITLEASSKQTQVLHDSQISASLSASHLAETLAQLTTTTQESMEKLNASAVQLAHSLSPRSGLIDLLSLMEAAFPIVHLPIFPVLAAVLNFLLYLLHSSCSALISIALLVFSSRKYIIRPDTAVSHVVAPFCACKFHATTEYRNNFAPLKFANPAYPIDCAIINRLV